MMSRNHVLAGAFAFLCTIFASAPLHAVEEDNGSNQALLPLTPEQSREAQAAQAGPTRTVPLSQAPIVPSRYNGDVRDLPKIRYPRYHFNNEFAPPPVRKPVPTAPSSPQAAPVLAAPMPSPSHSFAGLGFLDNINGGFAGAGWPPDTNGDVGPIYYIQAVNDAWGIFDKRNGSQVAAFTENQLWSGAATGTPCDADNFGDPVVVHDAQADRWILTNFAFATGSSPTGVVAPFYQCFAVSQSSDPVAGGWYLYAVQMDVGTAGAPPANTLVDYPKFGVWTDCLYMGANGFDNTTGGYAGPVFAAFDRTALYAGTALNSSNSSIGFTADTNTFSSFPAVLNGNTTPPAGTPEYFVAESSVAFAFDVRKFQAGATACGAGSTLSAATNVSQATYGYPAIKVGTSFTTDMVKQPVVGTKLDSLGDRVMQRVVYQNLSGVESLWVVHTTCGSLASAAGACKTPSSPTQPQWAQISVTAGVVLTTPVQQQIYAPDATLSRWMGSLALDKFGDMALGYSTSSGAAFPSLAYSGRLVSDTLNQLPQTEVQLAAGNSSQNDCTLGGLNPGCTGVTRWGDYSAMTIDPADDCTFWYTSEYYPQATNTGEWQTRIGSFRFPGCGGTASQLAFTIEPNASYAANGTITVAVTVEDAGGNPVVTDTSAITLTLQNGNPLATLTSISPNPANAIAGTATFTVSVDKAGTGYTLHATDAALTPADSSAFAITAGAAANIAFTQQPVGTTAGTANPGASATGVVVTVTDSGSNPVAGESVSLAVNTGPGTLTVTSPQTTDASGNATFTDAVLTAAGTYTLHTADGSLSANSNSFVIGPAAAQLVFTTDTTSDVTRGNTLYTIAVTKQDVYGNLYSSDTDQIDFSLPSCGGFALGSVALSGGTATLTGGTQRLYTLASGLQVTANDATASLNVLSTAFNVTDPANDFVFADSFDGCRP